MASFLVLWDVDFTLVNASGVGRYLYRLAFAELYGRELPARANEANMAGRTDRAIALDVLALADVPDPPGRVSEFEAALARLAPSLAELVATTAKALPGAAEALAALAALTGTNPGCDQSRSARKPAGPGVPQPDPSPASNGPACHSPSHGPASNGPASHGPANHSPASHSPSPSPSPASPSPASHSPSPTSRGPASNGPANHSPANPDQPDGSPAQCDQADADRPDGHEGRCTARQSLLTGNVRPLAEVKLAPLGLTDHLDLDVGAYGNEHEVRAELVHLARKRAALAYDDDFSGEATVIIGDTPLDVAAGLATGARTVGVATGFFTMDELVAAGAHTVMPDLTDTAAVLAAVCRHLPR